MLPTISIGPLVFPTAGLVYILGAWVILSLIERAALALKLDAEATYSLSVTTLAVGFIGARLTFVALHWSAYQDNLAGIVWPLTSGFHLGGGLLFALLAAIYYGRARQLPPAETLDALLPGLVGSLMLISLADFLAGPGYGTETAVPWAIDLFGIRRHPVQLYEVAIGLLSLIAWWKMVDHRAFPGQLFLISLAIYSGGRLFFDAFRANTWLTDSGYHLIQIISLFLLLSSLLILARQTGDEEPQPELKESS